MRTRSKRRVMLACSSRPTKSFGELLTFYTTLSFERVAEADLRTVQRESFSHLKPTGQ